jgi:hypothetical protein
MITRPSRGLFVQSLLASLTVSLVACGPTTTTTTIKPPPPKTVEPPLPKAESPSHWALHPSHAMALNARLDLGGSGVLYAGAGGERWLEPITGGAAVPSTTLLPESIDGIARVSGELIFVGHSGSIYAAKEPLGPVTAKRPAPVTMRAMAAGKAAVLGISDVGVHRTVDGGVTWTKVTLPSNEGTPMHVAMLPSGLGLVLVAPQRVFATNDDGATFTAVPSPGVGARRAVADVNGDLIIEGVEASAILRDSPLRLEKINRSPTVRYDLAAQSEENAPSYADAIATGHGAMLGTHYVEAIPDGDDATRWVVGIAELGKPLARKKVRELDGCENVFVGGDARAIVLACDVEGKPPADANPNKKPKMEERWHLKLLRSDDLGKTFKLDGTVASADRPVKHVWLGPDGTLVVDGGCKRSRSEWSCEESPPVVRAPGQSGFAKTVGAPFTHFSDVAFHPTKTHAYAIGFVNNQGRLGFYVSRDGGKDFVRKNLPAVPMTDEDPLVPEYIDGYPGSISIDDAGNVVVAAYTGDKWVIYTTSDDGETFKPRVVPMHADAVAIAGVHGFAYVHDGPSFETNDAGATWSAVDAPQAYDERTPVACGTYGCFVGDRATRVGWDGKPGTADGTNKPASKNKLVSSSVITCDASGSFASLGSFSPLGGFMQPSGYPSGMISLVPSGSHADVGGGTRFTLPRRSPKDGSIVVVVGDRAKKGGFETKEISLFPAAPRDSASNVSMQLEGVAALRYTFKREQQATTSSGKPNPPILIKKPPMPGSPLPITPKQLVDVEVAWYVAATGKVHRATIKGVGPLEPFRDLVDGRDQPSSAKAAMISIAIGGIHVRPLGAVGVDGGFYFVSNAGKVEKLTWPDMPKTDVRGKPITFASFDAARVGKRSVVFGNVQGGLQMLMAWGNETGTSWETRTWGIWPEYDEGIVRFRYFDVGSLPAFGALYTSAQGNSAGWMMPLKGPENDPSTVLALPTSKSLGDAARICQKIDWNATRLTLPWATGTRHPVVVKGDGVDMLLATSTTIARVTSEKEWCVSAYDALPIKSSGSEAWSAIIPADDLEHAALFKQPKGGELSVRPMTCRVAKDEKVPEGFAGVSGFTED